MDEPANFTKQLASMPALFDRALSRLRGNAPAEAPPSSLPASAPGGLESLVDALPCGVAVFDAAQRMVSCNTAFRRLLSLDDALFQSPPEFGAVVEATQRACGGQDNCGLLLLDGRPQGAGVRKVERRLGAGLNVEVHTTATPEGGFSLAVVDITAIRQAEAHARQAQAVAQKAQEEARIAVEGRNQFAFNMAHELRTPMNAISGMLQLIDGSGLNTAQKDYVNKARSAARALTGVMSNVLDFATVEAGEVQLHPHAFAVEEMLRDLAAVFGSLVGGKPVEVIFDIDPQLPRRLIADDQRLRQVIINLGSNAIKFTERGEVVLAINVTATTAAEIFLEVSVTDTGLGIAPDKLPALLKGMGQAEGTSNRSFGGNGLGLAICRNLLELMGSDLVVRSEPGRGSRFAFPLKLAADATDSISEGTPENRLRVLVADSRAASRQARVRLARSLGWQVLETETLAATLDALRQSRFLQLALIDWRLEDSAPFSAALRAAEVIAGRPLPVVVLGAATAQEALAALPAARRRLIAAAVCGPATPGMLADAAREAQGEGDTARVQVLTGRPLTGLRVLVAEDNENNQIVIRDLLQAQGAKVDIAVDGLDTLTSIVANGQYDVILMDWQMPNMDGLEATREIRQIVGFEHIPIIALTANATAADRDTCLAVGMDAHLAKPVDARQLVLTLLRHARPGTKLPAQLAPAPATAKAAAPAPASATGAPRIERDAAIEKFGGDVNLYTTVVERFAKEAPESVDDMAAALRSGARKEAHRLAHTLKGNAALIGAIDLSQFAKDAEAAFAGVDTAGDEKTLAALRGAIDATLKALASMG